MRTVTLIAGISVLALGACTHSGNMERQALKGAALGAFAGAVIGNNTGSGDAESGAIIGGLVGGAAGAYMGCRDDRQCGERYDGRQIDRRQYYDQYAGRYYFYDPVTDRTYWENGEPRS